MFNLSQRVSLNEIIRQYGVPLTVLEVMATNEQCIKLRDYLIDNYQNDLNGCINGFCFAMQKI